MSKRGAYLGKSILNGTEIGLGLLTRTISNNRIEGKVAVPSSEDLLSRYLICSALSGRKGRIKRTNNSGNIQALEDGMQTLGLGKKDVGWENFTYRIDCAGSRAAYKLLMPIACAMGKKCIFALCGTPQGGSMDDFYRVLRTHGVKKEELSGECTRVSGTLTGGTYLFPGEPDAQALAGLLTALPLIKEKSTVMVEKTPRQERCVDMTVKIMREAGIKIDAFRNQNGLSQVYKIDGGQKYAMKSSVNIEGDWTLAAFWLSGAAIGGTTVTCTNLNASSLQGDSRFLRILDLFGANLSVKEHIKPDARENGDEVFWSDVTVSGGNLKAVNIDAADIPALLAPVLLLSCAAEGVSIIKNIARQGPGGRRTDKLTEALRQLGARITEVSDGILVEGSAGAPLAGGRVSSRGNSDIALSAAIASCVCSGPVVIEHGDEADRVYPGFFEELERMKTVISLP